MSEYFVKHAAGGSYHVYHGDRVVFSGSYYDAYSYLKIISDVLNSETAALRQQIADLQAENAKLKADCASYDKVLNDVAIGYLEATEKLKEVEAKESPALAETESEVTPAAEKELETLVGRVTSIRKVVTAKNETMAFVNFTHADGLDRIVVFPKSWAENKHIIEASEESQVEIEVRASWQVENWEYFFDSLISYKHVICKKCNSVLWGELFENNIKWNINLQAYCEDCDCYSERFIGEL